MLLTKLARSGKATFWSQRAGKGNSKEILLASESPNQPQATVLDIVVRVNENGGDKYMAGKLELQDEDVRDLMRDFGHEESTDDACARLANLLVAACNQDSFTYKSSAGSDSFVVSLHRKVGKLNMIPVEVQFHKTFPDSECPPDFLRILEIFSREPRKESKKRTLAASQTSVPSQVTFSSSLSTTQALVSQLDGEDSLEASEGTEAQRTSKVVVRGAEKKKKKLRI